MNEIQQKNNLFGWWKKVVFENYANFKGRARRAEYWNFTLANVILLIPFYVLGIIGAAYNSSVMAGLGFLGYGVGALGTILPSLAVCVRRLHDLNKSGWYYFICLIPLVGPIILLVWLFTDGNRFVNEYGEDPKNPAGPVFDFEQQPAS
ncbi:MAG: DUF805 domain-containing protein [Chitinophagaceae bacterium]|nr:DUF805 domain-containing protein [Chitinophagaceae bacterium]